MSVITPTLKAFHHRKLHACFSASCREIWSEIFPSWEVILLNKTERICDILKNIQGEHKIIVHVQSDRENKCRALRTFHPYQSIEKN
jgi:hypothetical protein